MGECVTWTTQVHHQRWGWSSVLQTYWPRFRTTRRVLVRWVVYYESIKRELNKRLIRLINEQFASVMGECVIWTPQVRHQRSGWSSVLQTWWECWHTRSWTVRRTPRPCSGTDHWWITLVELLKLQRSCQFPDEFVKIEDTQIHCVS